MSEKYNGWANYETWVVNLWLTNDEGLEKDSRGVVAFHDDKNNAGDALKYFFEEVYAEQLPENGPIADLINASLRVVDWREIAEHMQED